MKARALIKTIQLKNVAAIFALFCCMTSVAQPNIKTLRPVTEIDKLVTPCLDTADAVGDKHDWAQCLEIVLKNVLQSQVRLERIIDTELQKCNQPLGLTKKKASQQKIMKAASAWKAYVKNQCEVILLTYGQGTGYGMAVTSCVAELNLVRNKQLEIIAAQIQGLKLLVDADNNNCK